MSEIQDLVKNIITETETVLNRTLDNVYINTTIKVLLGLYAAFAAPKLPPTLVNLMDNIFVRIGFAFTISERKDSDDMSPFRIEFSAPSS